MLEFKEKQVCKVAQNVAGLVPEKFIGYGTIKDGLHQAVKNLIWLFLKIGVIGLAPFHVCQIKILEILKPPMFGGVVRDGFVVIRFGVKHEHSKVVLDPLLNEVIEDVGLSHPGRSNYLRVVLEQFRRNKELVLSIQVQGDVAAFIFWRFAKILRFLLQNEMHEVKAKADDD